MGNGLARALDLIAFYGGARNRITGNRLSHGDTAGIYVNVCAKPNAEFPAHPTDFRITGNQVSNMREHGIDIVGAVRPVLDSNQVGDVGGAGIALAGTSSATVTHNSIRGAALAYRPPGGRQTDRRHRSDPPNHQLPRRR
ncbi:MAG: right-handed parallel beta-helix repeat-containing protein [Rhodospirillales bacterium]